MPLKNKEINVWKSKNQPEGEKLTLFFNMDFYYNSFSSKKKKNINHKLT